MISAVETMKLQKAWGDRPCDHPAFEQEYAGHPLGKGEIIKTGDYVCTTCGLALSYRDYDALTQARKQKKDGMNEELLSTEQAAKELGISRQRLHKIRRDGKIRAVQIRHTWVYPRSAIEERQADVQRWVEALTRSEDTPNGADQPSTRPQRAHARTTDSMSPRGYELSPLVTYIQQLID